MMHTVLGSQVRPPGTPGVTPGNKWFSDGADGVSPGIGVVTGSVADALHAGDHTNWMFTEDQAGAATGGVIRGEYIGGISAHENAHSFGLFHQGDYTGNGATRVAEYSFGDDSTGPNNYGTYIPIIGDANNRQRIAWRDGTADVAGNNQRQNDLKVMLAEDTAAKAASEGRPGGVDLHFVDDGIGNTLATATPLPLIGATVNFSLAKGVIVPKSESNPVAFGASNYTTDYFSFTLDSSRQITLSAIDSTQFLTPGIADSAGTLNSSLYIFNAAGTQVGSSTEDVTTLIDTYTGTLAGGTYFAAIGSRGGHQQVNAANYDPATYFDTGAFFLTGSGFASGPVNTGNISGVLFNDSNGNGVKDGSESATGARTVFIDTNGNGVLNSGETSTMSNAAGQYTFTGVPTGSTKVTRVFPKGYKLSNPSAGTNGLDVVVNVTANTTATANIGTYGSDNVPPPPPVTGTIAGTLWNDANANGIFDTGFEAGSGVRTVFIDLDRDGFLDSGEKSTKSDSNGNYSFTTMPTGTYAISRVFPKGYSLSNPSAGTNGHDVLVTLTGSGTKIVNLGSRTRVMAV